MILGTNVFGYMSTNISLNHYHLPMLITHYVSIMLSHKLCEVDVYAQDNKHVYLIISEKGIFIGNIHVRTRKA